MKKITSPDFEKNHKNEVTRWLNWLSFCLMILMGTASFAQVNAYSFAQSQGVYQSISSDGQLVSGSEADAVTTNDTSGWDISMPFDFNLNSITFNSLYANSNGGATFGLTNNGSSLLSATTAYSAAIAVMNRDLWGVFYTSGTTTSGSAIITNVGSFRGIAVGKTLRTGSGVVAGSTVVSFNEAAGTITMSNNATTSTAAASIGWGTGKVFTKTDGVAPNRIFTIQWEGYNDYSTAATASNYMSFQLKLEETTNKIQVVYGPYFNISTTARTNQVGLRGATNTDFNNRTGAAGNSWNATAAGITNSANVSRDNVNFPASGLTFTWSPPTCLPPGELTASNISTTGATLGWTSNGTLFDVQYGLQGFTLGSGTIVSAINTNSFTYNSFIPSTSYSFYVRTDCGAIDGKSNWAGPFNFTTSCTVAATFTEDFDTYTAVGVNNPLPNCWSRFGNTGSSYISTGSNTPLSAPNRLYLSGSATTNTNGVAVMPPVSNLSAETHRLKFMAYASTANKLLEVGYYANPDDESSFFVTETFAMPSTALSTATEFIYTPQGIPSGVQSLAFRANGSAFTGTTTIYIDNVVWEELPSCFDITEVIISNITASTVDLEWQNGGTETAWEYVYGPSDLYSSPTFSSPTAPALVPTSVVNTPYSSITTNLDSSTTYNFWIRSVCGANVVGNWSNVFTFTTACAPVTALPWNEGFEGVATVGTNAFPPCWDEENGDWTTAIASNRNTPKTGVNYLRESYSATDEFMWTPGFALTAGVSYDFSFYVQGDGHPGWTIDLFHNSQQISTNATPIGDSFILPTGVTSPITIQEYQLVKNTFIPNSTDVYYFGIRVNQSATTPWYIAFDDFKMEVTPTCIAPTVASATNITSSSATVSWSAPAVPTEYAYFVTTDVINLPDASTIPTGILAGTVNQIVLTLPSPSTVYKFYVKAICSSTDSSSWSGASTFTTACGLVDTFEESFDTTTTGSTNPLPLCWVRAGSGSTYVTTGGAAPGSAPNRLYMSASGTTPTQAIAIMPSVSNLQANTHRLTFKAYASTAGKQLEIGYFTDATDLTTFTLLHTVNLPSTTAATAQTFTYNPSNIPAGINALAFRNISTPTSTTVVYIDDVAWLPKPTVVPACTTATAVPNTTCGNFATAITWNATPNADGYYLNITATPGGALPTIDAGSATSYNYLGTAGTSYNLTVVPYNSAGSATACSSLTFVTLTNGCYCTSVPTSNTLQGISNVQLGNQNFANGDVMYFDHTANVVDLPQAVVANLKVTFATGVTYGTNVWIDLNNNFNFEADELVFQGESTNINPTVLDASFVIPANAPLGVHRMRIVATDVVQNPANPCYSGTLGVTLDFNVNITTTPTCLAPAGLSVDPNSITTTSATISWIASTTQATGGYEYYHSASNTPPTAATLPSGSVIAGSTTANLIGLPSSSTQYVYVRAVCSTTDFSGWSQAIVFNTLCNTSALPYTIDFEEVTIPNLPQCTVKENVGTGNDWETFSNPGYGFTNKTLRYKWNSSNAADAWFYTNLVNLVAGTQYSVSYKYGGSSTSFIEKLKVAYGTTANSTAMTTVLADHPDLNTALPQNNIVTFTPATSGTYVIGFHAYSGTNQFYLLLDDIVIEEVLATPGFEQSNFTAYPNPVSDILNVSSTHDINEVTVFNLLGQQLFAKTVNASKGQIDMSSLASGTYLVKVRSGDKIETIKVIKE